MPGSIIYRNQTGTVFLLDIPKSLQDGQQSVYALKSSAAMEIPYHSTEPKGKKKQRALAAIPLDDRLYHESVQVAISNALAEIGNYLRSSDDCWCSPRLCLTTEAESSCSSATEPLSTKGLANGNASPVVVLSTTEARNRYATLEDLQASVVHNFRPAGSIVRVNDLGDFTVPAHSSFILATLEKGLPAFDVALDSLEHRSRGFDLILMDPPWSNRSVRHAKAYQTQEHQQDDPFEQAAGVVRKCLAPDGLAAVWITNKRTIRDRVVRTFKYMDLHLCQEWVWIKVTSTGEPVTQLDGIWRRPYEMLLLFRRGPPAEHYRRRVIAAVPDLHSRKPCLKLLFEEMLPRKYNALEVFARSVTAGWWSWGDEVLKFQHESHWVG